jgi:hypothetical protein
MVKKGLVHRSFCMLKGNPNEPRQALVSWEVDSHPKVL